ncbi:hypothetical protein PRIPAC_85335, partial [Pristionchus pacificus]|uniref:Uncharacterized protein n=1 Tax=Pristionchus pacificus TaxID=54126 RepID=A0A2A6C9L6_PRIPA
AHKMVRFGRFLHSKSSLLWPSHRVRRFIMNSVYLMLFISCLLMVVVSRAVDEDVKISDEAPIGSLSADGNHAIEKRCVDCPFYCDLFWCYPCSLFCPDNCC